MAVNRSAPESFCYDNEDKRNKNFMYKNLRRSKCYNCNFSQSNFNFTSLRGAHFKKCLFIECTFKGAEFIGSNLKGCKFKKAFFENTVFEGANLDNADFNEAIFKNVIFVGCDVKKAKNLNIKDPEIRIFDSMPEIEMSPELEKAAWDVMNNAFIKKSRLFDTKDGKLNTLTLLILSEEFDEEKLIKGLKVCEESVDRDFHTLTYITRIIRNMNK